MGVLAGNSAHTLTHHMNSLSLIFTPIHTHTHPRLTHQHIHTHTCGTHTHTHTHMRNTYIHTII